MSELNRWTVRIPEGNLLAGINRFDTKSAAECFMQAVNANRRAKALEDLRFYPFGPYAFESA